MGAKYSVPLKTFVKEVNLQPVRLSSNYEKTVITMSEVNRPALQLAGFYDYFDPKRMQAIGKVETTYLETLSHEGRLEAFEKFMAYDIVALAVCHGCRIFPECLEMAKKLGYSTFFWSLAYVDWNTDAQPSHEEAFKKLTGRIHPGAIVLLHNTSRTNGEILDELLTKWENMGYTFGTLEELTNS